ncbi:uncharacterized protein TM35_000291700, partial [Trypanosoma theileri]
HHHNASTGSEVCPLKWKDKHFFIALRVEGEDKLVELPRLSSKLPTAEEVMAYCAAHAEQHHPHEEEGKEGKEGGEEKNSSSQGIAVDTTARAQLPTPREIQQMRSFRQSTLIQHTWTPEEVAEMRERKKRLGVRDAGSAPVHLTVNALHNMRLETELGIASSRHATGHTAMALERRTEPVLLNRKSQTGTTTIITTQRNESFSQSQSQSQGGWVSGMSLADLAPGPLSPLNTQEMGGSQSISSPVLSQKFLERWEESKQCEESFYAYVSDERRSAYMSKITRITQQNYELNKRDRLRGIDNEKRLDRKGNLLESGGLWIVDDQRRAQLAHKYQMEQDGENAGTTAGDGKKNAVEKNTEDAAANTTAPPPPMREEDVMLQRFISERKSQELSFSSVPDEFMTVDTITVTPSLSEKKGMEELQQPQLQPTPTATTRSPELLLLGASPRIVTSQLLHQVVSSSMKRAATYNSLSVEETQSETRSVGGEPPRKAARHA